MATSARIQRGQLEAAEEGRATALSQLAAVTARLEEAEAKNAAADSAQRQLEQAGKERQVRLLLLASHRKAVSRLTRGRRRLNSVWWVGGTRGAEARGCDGRFGPCRCVTRNSNSTYNPSCFV